MRKREEVVGTVLWLDGAGDVGVLTLADGREAYVQRLPSPPAPAPDAGNARGRNVVAEALRRGSWGDGGRDY